MKEKGGRGERKEIDSESEGRENEAARRKGSEARRRKGAS